jgi:hypothetical protein
VIDDDTTTEPEPDEEDGAVSTQEFDMIIYSQSAIERSYSSCHDLAALPVCHQEKLRGSG